MAGLFDRLLGRSGNALAAEAAPPTYKPGLSDAEIDMVFERARNELAAKTDVHAGTWNLDKSRWAVDLEVGTLTFTNPKGWTITAPVQVVGTLNTADGTFLWGWDHPSVPEARAADARLVRDFGAAQGLEQLTTRKIAASEDEAWELTALAVHLAGAQGAYRGPTGQALVFMTFGTVSIAKS